MSKTAISKVAESEELDNNTPESMMVDALGEFCKTEGLPNQCIEELLYLDTLTEWQRGWLECALAWWEVVEREREGVKP